MFTPHRSSTLIPAFIAMLTFALSAPGTMYAEDQILADASVLVAVDESSSAGAVDVSRAAVAPLPDSLPAALASGTRPEFAHLATVPLPDASVRANSDDRIANALFDDPILVPVPSLTDVSATTQTTQVFTVTGKGFTAGGRVYLAIYDQMGAQLYETRWITASPALAAVEGSPINGYGGTLREAFADLCGATAMMRAYDEATANWSNWLTVEPTCAAYVEPRHGPR